MHRFLLSGYVVPLSRQVTAAGAGIGILGLPGAYPIWDPIPGLLLLSTVPLMMLFGHLRPSVRLPLRCLPWVLAGYLYGHWILGGALEGRVPLCADAAIRTFGLEILDRPLLETGTASGDADIARFRGRVQPGASPDCPLADDYEVRLTWYDPPALARGERWVVEGRLRPPWGNRNPGGFDYERWLLGQSLAGTGYVRSGHRISASAEENLAFRIRSRLARWVQNRQTENAGIVLALMTGDDSGLDQAQWRQLRDSGTVHLLIVSGLHVGMVSGFLFGVGGLAARMSAGLLRFSSARRAAAVFALLGSGAYVWISGSGVPAVRAWLMSAVVLAALTTGRAVRGLEVVGLVMALLLLSNPLVVHQQGFWLSFTAVLALVGYFGPHHQPGLPRQSRGVRWSTAASAFLAAQLVLLAALSPLLGLFQGGIPLQSPVINALVVPVVTFAVLPLLLLSAVVLPVPPLAPLADGGLALSDSLLSIVMRMIDTAAGVPGVSVGLDGAWEWLLMLLVLALWQRRPDIRAGLAGLALWWVLMMPDGHGPRLPGEFTITALDVGQGSSILVDTHRHRLIFDAGPRYASGFDLGDAVVVPSFRQRASQVLSALVLSHDDLDHTGGAAAVVRQLEPARIWSSFPLPESLRSSASQRCTSPQGWQWDGVQFDFLHPPEGWQGSDNDHSCVLRISNGVRSALLAGDISRRAERRLSQGPVNLLMAPHHGSRTSSSPGFVREFSPGVVFVSTDRRSRYGHPHPEVVERYARAAVHITGADGALRWYSGEPERVVAWRRDHGAYWHRWQVRVRAAGCPACE